MSTIVQSPTSDGGLELKTTCPNGWTPPVTVYSVGGFGSDTLNYASGCLARNHERSTQCTCLKAYFHYCPLPDDAQN